MRIRMDEYCAIVKQIARKHDAIFVDVQAAFDQLLKKVSRAGAENARIVVD
ncbi:MAG: hypothetical protein HGA90_06925 [Alphaproteobacteria bacterium]|nr:hypothetical protein [Alphaproteobacteria bacterium]